MWRTASYVLLHEELVDRLLLSDELHDESVQVDKESPAKTTGNAAHKHTHTEEGKGLVQIECERASERENESHWTHFFTIIAVLHMSSIL